VLVAHTLADKLLVYGTFSILGVAILTAAVATWLSRTRAPEPSTDADRTAPSSL
jgi:hypothetical protein